MTPDPLAVSLTARAASDDADARRLRRAVALALVAHLAFFAVTFPELAAQEATKPPPKAVVALKPVRFQPPPPPPPDVPIPDRPTRRVPVPDPDPDDPEPVYVETPPVVVPPPDLDVSLFTLPEAPPEPPAPDVLEVGKGGVAPPHRLHYVAPRYTEPARRIRLEGAVVLRMTIGVDGRVADVEVLKGLPLGLTEEALRAVAEWRFEPSTWKGRPVPVLYQLSVHFTLR